VSVPAARPAPRPGRWLQALCIAHGAIGAVVYRNEIREMATEGFGSVPYRSERAAALWFVGSAFPGWLVGHFADRSLANGDDRSALLAGGMGTIAGAGSAYLMPRSLGAAQVVICANIIREALRARR
jgi:hypothetical protein